jgi:hypothetical protein
MPRLAPSIIVAVALLVAGCGDLPNPLATRPPPDALHPNQPIAIAPTPVPKPEKLAELDRQRAIWKRAGIGDYAIQLVYGCECGLGGQTVDVTVRGGTITEASTNGQPLDLGRLTGFPATVDQLFDYAERNAGAGKVELAYDKVLGYPTALGVDPDLRALDDEIRIAVLEVVPGR